MDNSDCSSNFITLKEMETYNKIISIEINIEVKTYDIDVAGHVNNVVYIRWLEDMRIELLTKIYPLEKLLAINFYPVVTSSEIKYKKQIKLFDRPVGKMLLQSYSHGVFILKAEIIVNGKLSFTATQKCVLMNLTSGQMLPQNQSDLLYPGLLTKNLFRSNQQELLTSN